MSEDNYDTEVTEVEINPIKPRDGLVALASCVVDDKFYMGSIGIYTRLEGDGYRLTYPTKKVGGDSINIYHPINEETGQAIKEAIVSKYEELEDEHVSAVGTPDDDVEDNE